MAERNLFSRDGQALNTSISIADAYGDADSYRAKSLSHPTVGLSQSLSVPGDSPLGLVNAGPARTAPDGSSLDSATKVTSAAALVGMAHCYTAPGRNLLSRVGARGIEEGVTVA
jgi:hypothetical protein